MMIAMCRGNLPAIADGAAAAVILGSAMHQL
jgi:hypothetical protein